MRAVAYSNISSFNASNRQAKAKSATKLMNTKAAEAAGFVPARKAASLGEDEERAIAKTKKGKAKTPRTGWCSVHNPAAKQVRKITATLVGAMSLVPTNSIENIGSPRKNNAISVVTTRCFLR